MTDKIEFYSRNDRPYGCFSNFAPYPVRLRGKSWPTSEHYFQAQKFSGTPREHEIRRARTPRRAARLGRDRRHRPRRDWERVKDSVMYDVVLAKFEQHADIRERLLSTGEATIVEHTANDDYWGDGGDGSGRNMLGRILMRVRAELGRRG